MLKIRLSRTGKRNQPSFKVVVQEHTAPIKGKFIEELGFYRPAEDPKVFEVNVERIKYWMSVGATPSDTMAVLLKRDGMEGMDKFIAPRNKQAKKKKEAEEKPAAPAAEAPKAEAPAAAPAEEKPAAPAEEAPKAETPKEEPVKDPAEAVAEGGAEEKPTEEAPKEDTPSEQPKSEQSEQPSSEPPKSEEPPKAEQPPVEDPAEGGAEEPKEETKPE